MRVYFRSEMVAASGERFSPSAAKPRQVFADWQAAGVEMDVKKPWPVTPADLATAHDPAYVKGVLDGTRANGFGDKGEDVRKALPFTVGAMVCAAKHALKTGQTAAALCSGFHHAGYEDGGGFCTFNGLIVAAQAVHRIGARKVGILDLDEHYGNGTDQIIKHLGLDWISHFTAGATFHAVEQAPDFLRALPGIIKRKFWDVDVLIVQLGADPFVDDPLGGWLTMDQLRQRDRIVFETCAAMRLPVAWNLAGGYTRDADGGISRVLQIHRASAEEAIRAGESKRKQRKSA